MEYLSQYFLLKYSIGLDYVLAKIFDGLDYEILVTFCDKNGCVLMSGEEGYIIPHDIWHIAFHPNKRVAQASKNLKKLPSSASSCRCNQRREIIAEILEGKCTLNLS